MYAAAKQMQLSYVGRIDCTAGVATRCLQRLSMLTKRCDCNPSPRGQMPCAASHHREQSCRTDHARRLSGPSDVCRNMKQGVRIAWLTSDHFAAPAAKAPFLCGARPGPIARVPGVMRRASRQGFDASCPADRDAFARRDVRIGAVAAIAQRQASCCIQLCIWANASDRGLA